MAKRSPAPPRTVLAANKRRRGNLKSRRLKNLAQLALRGSCWLISALTGAGARSVRTKIGAPSGRISSFGAAPKGLRAIMASPTTPPSTAMFEPPRLMPRRRLSIATALGEILEQSEKEYSSRFDLVRAACAWGHMDGSSQWADPLIQNDFSLIEGAKFPSHLSKPDASHTRETNSDSQPKESESTQLIE